MRPGRLAVIYFLFTVSALCMAGAILNLSGLQEKLLPRPMLSIDSPVAQLGQIEAKKDYHVSFTFRNHGTRSLRILGNDGA